MAEAAAHCAFCNTPIVDPTTQVVHGDMTYCCANCAHMMEQSGSGSDPHTLEVAGDFRCSHCGAVIVDESSMESIGDAAYCCANCSKAAEAERSMAEDRARLLR